MPVFKRNKRSRVLSYLFDEYVATKPRREIIRDRSNPLNWYGDEEFRDRFRFTKPNFLFILRTLQQSISPQRNQGILIALRFFATGHFQVTDGDLTQESQPSVSRIIKRI